MGEPEARRSSQVTIHLTGLARELAPVPASGRRSWWAADRKTRNHADHCLPLTMANRLGFYVLSPGSFKVSWDGDWDDDVLVEPTPGEGDFTVDAHSAHATFTVQPGFIPITSANGMFVWIKNIPNRRGHWFTAMEALIEAWWQPGEFGIVCMMNRPGVFTVARGEPLAQMCVYRREEGVATLSVSEELPQETAAWRVRRGRRGYRKDLDYLKGRHPDGREEPGHITSWRGHGSER